MLGKGLPLALTAVIAGCNGLQAPEAPRRLVVRATDFRLEAPDTVPAGLTAVELHSTGPSVHHAQLIRLPDSLPPEMALARLPAAEPLPAEFVPVGGPEGTDTIARVVTAIVRLTPGRYLLLCRFTTGEVPHYRLGMARALVVIPSGMEGTSLSARDTFRLSDFAITAPGRIRAGADTFLVVNDGAHEHQVTIARILPGHSYAEAVREYTEDGAPAVTDILTGVAGLAPGESNLLPVRLAPGRYFLYCSVPDPASGHEHYAMGMVRELEVVAASGGRTD